MTRRGRGAIAAAAVVVAAGLAGAAVAKGDDLWRAAYPLLPARLQAAPYRLRGWVRGERTPVALPTPAARPTQAAGMAGAPPPTAAAPTDVRSAAATATAPAADTPAAGRSPASAVRATTPPPGTPPPPATPIPVPPKARIAGVSHVYQTWNNCGPATVSMALGPVGIAVDQATAARVLKPDPDDKNVGPDELAAFARGRGAGAIVRVDGDLDRLRALVAAGWPVIVETWFVPEPGDEMGHYRLVVGYDRAADTFDAMDSYAGPAVRLAAAALDDHWRVFNRTYVVVYPPDAAARVAAVLGPDADDAAMHARAVARARAEVDARGDAFAWFNLGSSLVGAGAPAAAADAFDRARALGLPWRMLWYQHGPFEAYAAAGRWDDVAALAEANLANAPNLEESLYWRGRARAAAGDAERAAADWRRALELRPGFAAAAAALEGRRGG